MISEHIFDVFSKDELDVIKSILKKIPQQDNSPGAYVSGFTSTDLIYPAIKKLVIDKISQHSAVKIQKLTVGQFLFSQKPFPTHTDFYHKGDSGIGQAFLIPLWQTPEPEPEDNNRAATIIFDQTWTETQFLADYILTNPNKPTNNAKSIWDHQMGHEASSHAEYLSVKMICPWVYGSFISWDRRLLHASNNYPKFGIKEKCALVLFCQ
jgi:hypothetical protein